MSGVESAFKDSLSRRANKVSIPMMMLIAVLVFVFAMPPSAWADDGALQLAAAATDGEQAMHRLYNPYTGEHFYTADEVECDNVVEAGWKYEGAGWLAPTNDGLPVHRLYNPYGAEHHYTPDAGERDRLVAIGWLDEGVGWYSDESQAMPLYRDYNPNAFSCNHNYTASEAEHQALMEAGWQAEGFAWFGCDVPGSLDDYYLYRIVTSDYEFRIPEYWQGHVTWEDEAYYADRRRTVIALKRPASENGMQLAAIEARPANEEHYYYQDPNNETFTVAAAVCPDTTVSVYAWNFPCIAWVQYFNAPMRYMDTNADDLAQCIDLSTGGAVDYAWATTYENRYNTLAFDYLRRQLGATLRVLPVDARDGEPNASDARLETAKQFVIGTYGGGSYVPDEMLSYTGMPYDVAVKPFGDANSYREAARKCVALGTALYKTCESGTYWLGNMGPVFGTTPRICSNIRLIAVEGNQLTVSFNVAYTQDAPSLSSVTWHAYEVKVSFNAEDKIYHLGTSMYDVI